MTTLNILGQEVDKSEETAQALKTMKPRYIKLIQGLVSEEVLDNNILMERLEENQLAELSLIELGSFAKKRIRVNTKL